MKLHGDEECGMDDQALFNWGFWDAYHTNEVPKKPEESAYMAGYACGLQQREASSFDTSAQLSAFAAFKGTNGS